MLHFFAVWSQKWRSIATCFLIIEILLAFSALTLLVGRQEGHPACKNSVVRYWHGYLSGVRCIWFAYGTADATVTSSSLAPVKFRMVYLSGAGSPRLSWKKAIKVVVFLIISHHWFTAAEILSKLLHALSALTIVVGWHKRRAAHTHKVSLLQKDPIPNQSLQTRRQVAQKLFIHCFDTSGWMREAHPPPPQHPALEKTSASYSQRFSFATSGRRALPV